MSLLFAIIVPIVISPLLMSGNDPCCCVAVGHLVQFVIKFCFKPAWNDYHSEQRSVIEPFLPFQGAFALKQGKRFCSIAWRYFDLYFLGFKSDGKYGPKLFDDVLNLQVNGLMVIYLY